MLTSFPFTVESGRERFSAQVCEWGEKMWGDGQEIEWVMTPCFCKLSKLGFIALQKYVQYIVIYFCWTGFVEKEIKKANILTVDTGENPEVPFPRDMIDLEVICYVSLLLKEIGGQMASQGIHDAPLSCWKPFSLLSHGDIHCFFSSRADRKY